MFVDARTVAKGSNIQRDICVIGAGAAGITFAREFIGKATTVCLLESGDLEFNETTQDLYSGENIGLPYFPLTICRLRFFGGTTNHWGGYNQPFSNWEFEKHPWIPNSGWPISRFDLDPYYDRAVELLGLPKEYWNFEFLEADLGVKRFPSTKFDSQISLIKPVPLGQVYRGAIGKSNNIGTFLNANVVSLQADKLGKMITNVRVATLSGNRFTVEAKYFVLAAGGLENPRILLLSNSVQRSGLGNQRGLVGRYFMDHPLFLGGIISPATQDFQYPFYGSKNSAPTVEGTRIVAFLALSEEYQKKKEMVASTIRLFPRAHESRIGRYWDRFSSHVENLINEFIGITEPKEKIVRDARRPVDHIEVHLGLDPVPNPESRVTLGEDLDPLGLRRVRVNWQLSEVDLRNAHDTLEILGAEVGRLGIGRLKSLLPGVERGWPESLKGANHHMGTTRMADDAEHGVVDTHCKVYGISNLYVAGSSVFPTAGIGSPTLMIIALTIRLADHIKKTQNV